MKFFPLLLISILAAWIGLTTAQAQSSTWNTTTGSWNTAGNWTLSGVPASATGTQLIFNASGTTSYTTTNNIGAFTLNKITVNNSGTGTVTIAASATANTLTFAGTTPTLDITGSVLGTVVLAGSATITKTGSGTYNQQSNSTFTGILNVDGGTFISSALASGTFNFNPTSIVVNSGGTYQFGENGVGDPNLPNTTYITVNTGGNVVWEEGETFGGFHLAGGTIDLEQGGATSSGTSPQSWTSGTLTGTGGGAQAVGGAAAINKTTSGTVSITGNASITTTTGGLNIQEGTIAMAGAGNLGTANVTLGAAATTGTFEYQGATASRTGTFGINAGGGVIGVTNAAAVLTLSGNLSGAGALSKAGAGTLHLTGALGGTGTTTASVGTLRVNPVTASGAIAISGGATLATNSGAGSASFTAPSLNFAAGTSTLQFELNTAAVTTAPLVVVSGSNALTFTGTPTLRVTNQQAFANGTYTLLDYSGTGISSGFAVALPGRTAGTLVYDTVGTKIDLSITGTDSVKWTGAINGNWDVGTSAGVGGTNNWQLVTGGTPTNFIDTDVVLFDDTATGYAVNLTTTVLPSTITVNAATNYTFSGAGKLSGTTTLSKSNTGSLILATDNDYSGATTITAGTLQLGNGGTTGSITSGVSLNGGTLAFNRSNDVTFGNTVTIAGTAGITQNGAGLVTFSTGIAAGANTVSFDGTGNLNMGATVSGTGILNKNGNGTLTLLANNNTFTGTLNVNAGTVQLTDLGAGGDLSAVSIVVNNGGTFIFGPNGNPDFPNSTYATVNTGGLFQFKLGETMGGLHLAGGTIDVELGGPGNDGTTPQSWTSGTLTGSGVSAQTYSGSAAINKTTSATVNVTGNASITGTGGLNIQEGKIAMAGAGNLGTANVTLGAAATAGTFEYQGITASRAGTFGINAGGGVIGVTNAAAVLTLSGNLSGAGNLSKAGAGALHLTGTLGGTGTTTATEGTLRVNPVTASGGFAIASGGTLAINSGVGTASFTTPTLNFAASNSTLHFELNTTAVTTAPLAVVSGSNGLTFTGTPILKVTNTQSFANGTYTLLDYTGTGISSGFTLSALAGRSVGTLIYDTVGTKIDLSISGDSVKWTGAINSTWDVGTSAGVGGTNNWQLVTGGTATNFIDSDSILFDDTATTFTVNLDTTALPSSMAVNANTNYAISGTGSIGGTGGLTKSGTGTLTLSTANAFSGATTINAGTISIDAENRLGVTADITLNGGTLATTVTFAIDDAGRNINLGAANGTINVASSTALTLSNGLLGAGTLTKEGTGTLILAGDQASHTGNFVINAGTLQAGPTDLNMLGSTSSVTLGGTGTLDLNGFTEGFGSLIGSSATSSVTNNSTGTTARLGTAPTANVTYDGMIVDGAGQITFEKSGNFNIKLTNANSTFSGTQTLGDRALPVTIELEAGGIEFTSNGALGVAGGDLYLDGGNAAVDKLIFGADNITLDSGRQLNINTHLGIDTGSFTGTIAGAILGDDNNGSTIGGNDSFRKQGTGTLILSGTMDQVDEVFVDAGTLRAESSLALAQVTVASGSTLQFGNGNSTGDINGATATVVNNGTVAFNRTGSLSFDNVISGTGSLQHNGSGTTTVTVAQTYSGGTTVTAGTLVAANATGSATGTGSVTVDSGATLAGTGTVAPAVNNFITINGTLQVGSPLSTVGTDLDLSTSGTGSTILGSTSFLQLDIFTGAGLGNNTGTSTAADVLRFTGDLNITSGSTLTLLNPNVMTTWAAGDSFKLFDWTSLGVRSGTWALDYSALNLGSTLDLDITNLYNAGTVSIIAAIPEPSRALLLFFGIAGLLLRRRR